MRASANRNVWRSASLDMSVRDDDVGAEDAVLADLEERISSRRQFKAK